MTSTTAGPTRTPLRLSDAVAVLGLANREEEHWFGEPMIDLEDLVGELRSPELDLETDTVAVRSADGRLIAAGVLGPRGNLEVYRDPDLASPQLVDALTDQLEARAAERAHPPQITQFIPRAHSEAAARLTARGYRLDYTAWILQLTDGAALAERELPPGYHIRPFAMADAEAVHALIGNAFGEWDQRPDRSFADWRVATLERPGVDPTNFRVATYRDQIVGASIVFDSGSEAWISQLATARDHRGRGVGQQLLVETFAAARARGLPDGGLSTDTRTGALGLYERLGMEVRHTVDCWARPVADL